MMLIIFTIFAVILSFPSLPLSENKVKGQNWAVLVAGSRKFVNYADQANVCHAFHAMVAHGIPKSNIIVMMFDDIANNKRNPFPGTIINQPDGPDVYQGVNKDYTHEDVTPENFMKVLLGDPELKARGKKVLESGPDDNVFIYFADHGGSMTIQFPRDILTAQDLVSTLVQMHEKQMYNKLLFYLDTCYSASMFEGLLPNNISIYATTSANSTESAMNCFCNLIEGACLASQYSFNWIVDSDVGKDFGDKTVEQQFQLVKNETSLSHPQEFGDLTIGNMPLSVFFGSVNPPPKPNPIQKCDDPIYKREVPHHHLKMRIARASDEERPELQKKLDLMIEAREYAHQSVRSVVQHLCSKGHCEFSEDMIDQRSIPITRHDCVEKLIRTFNSHRFNLAENPYTTKYLHAMVNIAEGLGETDLDGKCLLVISDLSRACILMLSSSKYEQIL